MDAIQNTAAPTQTRNTQPVSPRHKRNYSQYTSPASILAWVTGDMMTTTLFVLWLQPRVLSEGPGTHQGCPNTQIYCANCPERA